MRHKSISVRVALATLSVLLLGLTSSANAQPLIRIGVLHLGTRKSAAVSIEAFQRGMRELGYNEAKKLLIDYRYAEGKEERYPSLAGELAAMKPAVIVSWGRMLRQS